MIRIKIAELLAKNKLTQKQLSALTGIRAATISKMRYEENKRISIQFMQSSPVSSRRYLGVCGRRGSVTQNLPFAKTALPGINAGQSGFSLFYFCFLLLFMSKKVTEFNLSCTIREISPNTPR